jgi:hypothetical protein
MCQPQAKLLIWLTKSFFTTFGPTVGEHTLRKRSWIDWPE